MNKKEKPISGKKFIEGIEKFAESVKILVQT
jgi:hypothetical protein